MRDAGIGRVLVASLHQGIADLLPTRLEFYENWFSPVGLRAGTIGLAPLAAVLSFLRREGDAYAMVTTRAGGYAGEWTVDGLLGFKRAVIKRMPRPIRARLALGVSRGLVRASYAGSRAIVRVKRDVAFVDIRSSVFCGVREPADAPLCGFYAAAFERVLGLLGVDAAVEVAQCRGTGQSACVLAVRLAVRLDGPEPAGRPPGESDRA
jgi:hypothetical protein